MQLAIYQYYNGPMLFDVTFEAVKPEFSTNKYGFGYCKFSLNWTLEKAAQLFRLKNVGYVRLGTGNKSYFEGRLEDIEIGTEIIVTAFGYYRAFTDLQVNDLWSTTDYTIWKPSQRALSIANAYDDKAFNFSTDKELFVGLRNNVSYGNAPNVIGGLEFYLTSGYLRGIQCMSYTASGITANSFSYGSATRDLPGVGAYNVVQTSLSTAITTTVFHPNKPFAQFFYARSAANNLFVGEDNSQYMRITNLRIGTTPSISGNRLYADEILRFTASGVNTLNALQISVDFSGIQSPRYDLTDVWFIDQTGLDVVETLLSYPDINGNSYELKVWENQKILFRPKTSPTIWYIDISEIQLNRTLDKYYNQVNSRYKNTLDLSTFTTISVAGFHNRQTILSLNTSDPNIAATAGSTLLADYARKPPQSEISASYVRDSNGSYQEAINIRSGDTIIIQNIPPVLFDAIDNTFIVDETIADIESGIVRIIPEKPIAQLETLLSKVKL